MDRGGSLCTVEVGPMKAYFWLHATAWGVLAVPVAGLLAAGVAEHALSPFEAVVLGVTGLWATAPRFRRVRPGRRARNRVR